LIRETLTGLGFDEAISFSFVERELDAAVTAPALFSGDAVEVMNPILEHKPRMRTSLLTGLVEALELNVNHGTRSVRLFEIGKRFAAGESRPNERETLALLLSGSLDEHDFRARRESDFFELKGVVEALLDRLRVPGFTFERAGVEYLHRGQAASIVLDGETVGVLGRLSPELAAHRKIKQPVYVAEIALDRLLEIEAPQTTYTRLPKYPSVVRDISIVLPNSAQYAEIERAIRDLDVPHLASVALYDVFRGGKIAADHRSVTIRLEFRSDSRTLTDDEASAGHAVVVDRLARMFGAELR
jgi:phenylalanyl-tRNA synthetase beta chain